MSRATNSEQREQIDLETWARELESERERVAAVNEQRAARRGFLVVAPDPDRAPGEPGCRDVYATVARTPGGRCREQPVWPCLSTDPVQGRSGTGFHMSRFSGTPVPLGVGEGRERHHARG